MTSPAPWPTPGRRRGACPPGSWEPTSWCTATTRACGSHPDSPPSKPSCWSRATKAVPAKNAPPWRPSSPRREFEPSSTPAPTPPSAGASSTGSSRACRCASSSGPATWRRELPSLAHRSSGTQGDCSPGAAVTRLDRGARLATRRRCWPRRPSFRGQGPSRWRPSPKRPRRPKTASRVLPWKVVGLEGEAMLAQERGVGTVSADARRGLPGRRYDR